ncbi:glycosyltransferase family 4 protein [Thermococcus nautili]|nr:glycosyltransferase family 4 protein [Thermococcus nautili]
MKVIASPAYSNRLLNPYNYLLYSHVSKFGVEVEDFSVSRILLSRWNVWHLHWPEGYLNNPSLLKASLFTEGLLALLRLSRKRGIKIVWTVHNLRSHERYHELLENRFWKHFTSLVDGYIVLSETGRRELLKHYPHLENVPGFVIPHGHYRGVYPNEISREDSRRLLGLPSDAVVISFIGQIRAYKNVPRLMDVFMELSDNNVYLVIAGKPRNSEIRSVIEHKARLCQRIRPYLGFIPPEKIQIFLNSADLVVLPYSEIFHSGTALLALSFNRPVLVPNRGAMYELQRAVGRKWVMVYEPELTPDTLEHAINWALKTTRSREAPLSKFEWENIARETVNAYRVILQK